MSKGARTCPRCTVRAVAHDKAIYCYECRPNWKRRPPPCKRCGSTTLFYSAGLCQRCHKYAPPVPDSCPHCWSWGLFKRTGGICDGCEDWRRRNPGESPCADCGDVTSVNGTGRCRLCWRRARALARDPDDPRRAEAVIGGHQLLIAGLEQALALRTPEHQRRPAWRKPGPSRWLPVPRPLAVKVAQHRQSVLFDAERDLSHLRGRGRELPEPPIPELAEALEYLAVDLGAQYGWSEDIVIATRRALRLLLLTQDTPGAPFTETEVARLRHAGMHLEHPTQVLAAADMLECDRAPAIVTWFDKRLSPLPHAMAEELREWFTVMREGSSTAPRSRPRTDRTIRNHFTYALPVITRWSADHASLREITREDVTSALADAGPTYADQFAGLHSIFTILKGRRKIFDNPTSRLSAGHRGRTIPLPQDPATLRDILDPANVARAALAALLIFHGLRPQHVRQLLLTNVRDGRLHLGELVIPLAPPAARRISAYLDYRAQRWPNTANPHLFIHIGTATGLKQVNYQWVNATLGHRAQKLREDRILDEAIASGGDVRRVCDMFGLSVYAALRYIHKAEQPPDQSAPSYGSLNS